LKNDANIASKGNKQNLKKKIILAGFSLKRNLGFRIGTLIRAGVLMRSFLFLFQSSLDTNIHDRSPTKGSVGGGWVELPPTLPPVPDTALLCPTFAQFSFRWSLDTEEDDEYNRWLTKLIFKNRVYFLKQTKRD
jgi:hypothetical protein